MSERVEIFVTSSKGNALGREDKVIIRVGREVATLTAGEWSALICKPAKAYDVVKPS